MTAMRVMTKAFFASNNKDAAKMVITNSRLKCRFGPSSAKVSKLKAMTSAANNRVSCCGIRVRIFFRLSS